VGDRAAPRARAGRRNSRGRRRGQPQCEGPLLCSAGCGRPRPRPRSDVRVDPAPRQRSSGRVDAPSSRRRGRRSRERRAGRARGRLARARASRRARGTRRRLAGARRSTRRAPTGGRAGAERHGRDRGAGSGCARASSGSDGRAPRRSSAASSRSAPPRPPYRPSPSRRPHFVRAPRGERLHAALGATNPAPRASGEATLTKTPRLAGRTRPHRASPPRGRAPLSGLAAHRRRRARGNPQRGPAAHTLGRRIAERPPDADHHPRAGRRRSGPHRRDDARRNDRH
jgi:hypothetical protein